MFEGQKAGDDFDRTGACAEVPEVAFCGGHGDIAIAQSIPDSGRFARIALDIAFAAAVEVPLVGCQVDTGFGGLVEQVSGDVGDCGSDMIAMGIFPGDITDGGACTADDFAPDFRAASHSAIEGFEDQGAGTFADKVSVAGQVVGSGHFGGVIAVTGHRFGGHEVQGPEGFHARAGGSCDHHIGSPSSDGRDGLDDRSGAGGFSDGHGVARASQVVVDRHVACGHIGKVLQEPQRVDLGSTGLGPHGHLEFLGIVSASGDTVAKFFGSGDDVIAAEDDAEAVWIAEFGVRQSGVMQGELAGGDPHFDFPAHDFLVLFDGPLQVFVQGSEFGDFAGKAGGLSAEFAGDDVQGQVREGADP